MPWKGHRLYSKCNGKPSQDVSGGSAYSPITYEMKSENEQEEGLVGEEWTKELVKSYSSFKPKQKQRGPGRDKAANMGFPIFLS